MKKLCSYYLLFVALAALVATVIVSSPNNFPWQFFFDDPASLLAKAIFLADVYLSPAALSFVAIVLFQLQARLSMSGTSKRVIFPVCLLASLAMLSGFQQLSIGPTSAPGYALGMALGYTVMSRFYAAQMRRVWRGISFPWVVWRGNKKAVEEMNARMRAMAAVAGFNSKE